MITKLHLPKLAVLISSLISTDALADVLKLICRGVTEIPDTAVVTGGASGIVLAFQRIDAVLNIHFDEIEQGGRIQLPLSDNNL